MKDLDYSTLPTQDLLTLAVNEKDQRAIATILDRQRSGQICRVWFGPREGPQDDGMAAMTMQVNQDDLIEINVSPIAVQNGMIFDQEIAKEFIMKLTEKFIDMMAERAKKKIHFDGPPLFDEFTKFHMPQLMREFTNEAGSEGEPWRVALIGGTVIVYPLGVTWLPGIVELMQIITTVILTCEEAGIGLNFNNDEWTRVYPLTPDGMFPPPRGMS